MLSSEITEAGVRNRRRGCDTALMVVHLIVLAEPWTGFVPVGGA